MFITKLFKVAKNNLNILQLMKWINKMWYIHIIYSYLAIKRNKVLPYNMTGMNPENIVSSETSYKVVTNVV